MRNVQKRDESTAMDVAGVKKEWDVKTDTLY
jgi:hypothetical protein